MSKSTIPKTPRVPKEGTHTDRKVKYQITKKNSFKPRTKASTTNNIRKRFNYFNRKSWQWKILFSSSYCIRNAIKKFGLDNNFEFFLIKYHKEIK